MLIAPPGEIKLSMKKIKHLVCLALIAAATLNTPANAQNTGDGTMNDMRNTSGTYGSNYNNWGLIGLVGLIGLAGLRKKANTNVNTPQR